MKRKRDLPASDCGCTDRTRRRSAAEAKGGFGSDFRIREKETLNVRLAVAGERGLTGKRPERSSWRLLDHKSDSAGALAGTSQAIGKHLCAPKVGAAVAPEFMPKRNSEHIGSRGPGADDTARPEIGDYVRSR